MHNSHEAGLQIVGSINRANVSSVQCVLVHTLKPIMIAGVIVAQVTSLILGLHSRNEVLSISICIDI